MDSCANLNSSNLIIAIVAGEHSGDNYGAAIMQQLKLKYPGCKFIGVGGAKMQALGLESLMPMDILSTIGIVDVIKKLPKLILAKNKLVQAIIMQQPRCYIGIDCPDFNLVVAKKIKKISNRNKLNIKTIQYVSPTIWAWRAGRVKTVAKAIDKTLCIFPFEQEIYHAKNIIAKFVGHPLADQLYPRAADDKSISFRKIISGFSTNICKDYSERSEVYNKTIGIFPGSRSGELNSLLPIFLETIKLLHGKNKDYLFIVPIVNQKLFTIWQQYYQAYENLNLPILVLKTYEEKDNLNITSHDVMRACDIILCASGTTTLEACLLNIPMVVTYKVSKLNEIILRLLIKVKYIAMPNILSDKLLGKRLVPEFVQEHVNTKNLVPAVEQELAKYPAGTTNGDWKRVQNYLRSGSLNHQQAVLKEIESLLQ